MDISTISIDSSSSLILGGSAPFGFIQVYNPLNKTSIKEFDFGLSEILDIQIIDDVFWVLFRKGQEYGIMKFIYDREWQYRDSYNNFPTASMPISTASIPVFVPNNNSNSDSNSILYYSSY